MNEKSLLEILKTVSYPGFSRDIVSFGMVKKIEIYEKRLHEKGILKRHFVSKDQKHK